MEKRKYYVSVKSQEITKAPYGEHGDFAIFATDEEVVLLRAKMNRMQEEDFLSFWRAHIPFMPYHQNNPSDRYDSEFMETYEMIYNLGDEATKQNIDQMGILKNPLS